MISQSPDQARFPETVGWGWLTNPHFGWLAHLVGLIESYLRELEDGSAAHQSSGKGEGTLYLETVCRGAIVNLNAALPQPLRPIGSDEF